MMHRPESDFLLNISYGSFFGGACSIVLSKRNNETAVCAIYGYNGWQRGKFEEFTFPADECTKIEKMISPIKAWKAKYECEDDILDGHGWSIQANFGEKIEKRGYMAYPVDYWPVMRGILDCIESIRAYDDSNQKNIPLLAPDGPGPYYNASKDTIVFP